MLICDRENVNNCLTEKASRSILYLLSQIIVMFYFKLGGVNLKHMSGSLKLQTATQHKRFESNFNCIYVDEIESIFAILGTKACV